MGIYGESMENIQRRYGDEAAFCACLDYVGILFGGY